MTRCPHPEMVAVRMCESCGYIDKSSWVRMREELYFRMFKLIQGSGLMGPKTRRKAGE